MMSTLPFRPIPQAGESPLSVLRRGALGNHHGSALRFAYALNPALDHSPSGLASAARSIDLRACIFEPMGIPSEEADKVSYGRVGRAKLDALVWNRLQVPIGDLQFRQSRICVACYVEDGYAHSAWDHVATLACPKHLVLLDDACPCCGAPWKPAGDPLACGCAPDEMAARQQPCSARVASTMQRILDAGDQAGLSVMGHLWQLAGLWSALGLDLSRADTADVLAALSREEWPTLSVQNDGVLLHPRVALAPLLAATDPACSATARELLRRAMPVIRVPKLDQVRWPASVARAVLGLGRVPFEKLVQEGHAVADADGLFTAATLNELLWIVAGRLDAKQPMLPLATLRAGKRRESLAALVSKIKAGDIVSHYCPPPDGLSGLHCAVGESAEPEASEGVTLSAAAVQLGTNEESVRRAIKLQLLPASKGSATSAVQWTIDPAALEAFQAKNVFASEIARQHGVSVTTIANRLRSAGLEPISGPGVDGGATFIFKRPDLMRLDLPTVLVGPYRSPGGRKKGPAGHSATQPGHVAGHEAAQALGISVRHLREVIKAGWISPSASDARRQVFDRDAVAGLQLRLGRDFVPLEEAACMLGQTAAQFRKTWVVTGTLQAHRFADRTLVEAAGLDRAREIWREMGSASSIARGLNRRRWLCPNLATMGQLPAPTRLGTGARQVRLYPRGSPALQRHDMTQGPVGRRSS